MKHTPLTLTLKAVATFIGQMVFAFVSVAILKAPFVVGVKLFTNSSGAAVVLEWASSLILGAIVGFATAQRFKSSIGKWVWVAGVLFLLVGIYTLRFEIRDLWRIFSGLACSESRGIACVQFWSFTVPAIRLVAYSIGVIASSRLNDIGQGSRFFSAVLGRNSHW